MSSLVALPEHRPASIGDLGTGSVLHLGRLSSAGHESDFSSLQAEIDWLTMVHRGGEVPRLVATQGEIGPDGEVPLYRHPADTYPPVRPWTPRVDAIRREVEALVGHPLNHGLLQLYRDGKDWIGPHADKTLDIAPGSSIVNVSVGATRTMVLRRKGSFEEGTRPTVRIPLPHGSALQMSLETNRDWLHEVRKQGASGELEPRISLTFRWIGTRLDPTTGAVWGVGSPHASREAALAAVSARARWPVARREAWERDEAHRMLMLFREENQSDRFTRDRWGDGFEVVELRPDLED